MNDGDAPTVALDSPGIPLPVWSLLAGGTGAVVWVQTSFGAFAELVVGGAHFLHVALCGVTLAALISGLAFRHALTLMTAFPLLALACIATMSEPIRVATLSPARWIPWTASLATFLVSASTWLSQPQTPIVDVDRRAVAAADRRERMGALTVARLIAGPALLVVPAFALALATRSSSIETASALFAHLALTFAWSVAMYLFLVGPMLDAERNRRADSPINKLRLALLVLSSVALLALWWMLHR